MAAPEVTQAPEAVAPPKPLSMTIEPASDQRDVAPVNAVRVKASSGTLTDVVMTNESGKVVDGVLSRDRAEWMPAEPLGYGRTYTVTATGLGADAATVTRTSTFSTAVPQQQASVSLRSTLGSRLVDGASYGVGTVVVAQFDTDIPDRAAAERQLKVTTSPPVQGAWMWINDRKAHWRPKEYFPAGTKVRVNADIYGVDLGGGVYGLEDSAVDFVIGPKHVTIADDVTKQVSVFVDDKLVRTMPTSMGRGGTTTVGGRTIAFWTQPGIYTVQEKANPVLMDSSTYGLPTSASAGYKVSVAHAVRISPDGIYLHEREGTVWAQGSQNVSAGCLNLSAENAEWFYEFAQPGDVVEVRNTGGAPLEQWQNGDWSVPWDTWLAGSALQQLANG
ncbi:L,D-transpeptidase [Mycobacterium sp. MS1601]|uniref:L,D-transpeptidase n=1 Tax=Mycobacterium sp. MS1601 TaxID=1936029 RepID=UPI0026D2EBC4